MQARGARPDVDVPSRHDLSRHDVIALLVLAVSALLLWVWPPAGVVASVIVCGCLAPWGRSLGERAIVSTVVSTGVVATLFAGLTATGLTLAPLGWRVVVTACVVLIAACVRLPRSAPVWPEVGVVDLLGLGVGAVLFAMMALPYATASVPQTSGALLTWWDHSSFLPMFSQVMHSGDWNFSGLGDDLMFDQYPMLHLSLWSVGEWVSGDGRSTAGLDLVRPYVAWFGLTTALCGALLVWTAGLAARTVTQGDELGARRRTTVTFAAALVGIWCMLGSLTSMADFAFTNFLLAGSLCVSAVVVSVRNRAAMSRIGWFVMPLAVVSTAYLYPPLAGGTAVVAIVVLVAVFRHRPAHVVLMIGVGLICLAATVPSLRFLTQPFEGRSPGSIGGGIPPFELWPVLVVAPIVVVLLVRSRRAFGGATVLGLLAPIVVSAGVAVLFARQALVSGTPLDRSYYTLKIVYALMLVTIPVAAAFASRGVVRRISDTAFERPRRLVPLLVGGGIVAMTGILAASVAPHVPSQAVSSLIQRVEATTTLEWRGEIVVTAAEHPGDTHWTTVAMITDDNPGKVFSDPYSLEAGRTATGLGSVLTVPIDRTLTTIAETGQTQPDVEWGALLAADPALALRIVVQDDEQRLRVVPLLETYGPARVEILTATR